MKIAFVHHHFRPGGVTRVITDQITSLRDQVETLLIIGEPPSHQISFPFVVVPSLAYDRDRGVSISPVDIARSILNSVTAIWKGGADLYHFHNPTLGKNADLISAVKALISMKENILLQVHDFAEDGRPGGYSRGEYPADCHYAVINRRDYSLLIRSGLKTPGLHYIPNAIRPLKPAGSEHKQKDIVLYPIRAIRRKNIGEAILLSLFLNTNEKVGITLEPTGALDMKSYTDWRNFVITENLSVAFRLGIENDFFTILSRTRYMITTSIKEGFGFSFLEPWTANKMLFGRLLKDICSDFMNKGIKLDHLYEIVKIPLTFIDRQLLHIKWTTCYREKLNQYGIFDTSNKVEEYFNLLTENGCIDFGILSEDLQKQVILNILKSKSKYNKILDLNPGLRNISFSKESRGMIESNKKIIKDEYSPERNRSILLDVYRKVLSVAVTQSIDKRVLLDTFNTPEKNFLLLCDSAYG